MSAFWITLVGLLLAASVLFLWAGWQARNTSAGDRDRLNKTFYQQRLQELEEDEAQGVVAERPVMVRELQQTLLTDIPAVSESRAHHSSRWILLPALVALIGVTLTIYWKTGSLAEVIAWQQVQADYPQLRARVMDPAAQPLTMEELARLQLGLRSALQQDRDNLNDWTMLGRLGMVLNNATSARQAFNHALQFAPGSVALKLDYAEVLTRSADEQVNREGGMLLQDLHREQPDDLRILALLAFNAFNQQQYDEAIATWQQMLARLPAEDSRRAPIARSIEQAKTNAGQQQRQLPVTISLGSEAEKMLPQDGVLYISIFDGVSPVPVAVKRIPLSHFPLSLTLDDSNAMMPERLLSAQHQVEVRVRISRDGSATPQSGDWSGVSTLTPWRDHLHMAVEINQQQP